MPSFEIRCFALLPTNIFFWNRPCTSFIENLVLMKMCFTRHFTFDLMWTKIIKELHYGKKPLKINYQYGSYQRFQVLCFIFSTYLKIQGWSIILQMHFPFSNELLMKYQNSSARVKVPHKYKIPKIQEIKKIPTLPGKHCHHLNTM